MTDLIMTVLAQNRQFKSVIKLGAKVSVIQDHHVEQLYYYYTCYTPSGGGA